MDAYPDVHTKAAALLRSLACNHAFVDGNKRTALLSVIGFYGLNGYRFVADHTPLLHLVLDVATKTVEDVETIALGLAKWVVSIDEDDLPDDSTRHEGSASREAVRELDPTVLPYVPVMTLLLACEADNLVRAQSVLHPDLIADIAGSDLGLSGWWTETRAALTGYADTEKWTMTRTMDPVKHSKWNQYGVRVSITRRDRAPVEPGGVTAGGEPYEVLARPTLAEHTFWVAETDGGWRVRGFGVNA